MNFYNHNIFTLEVKIHMNKLLKNFEKRKEYDDEKFKSVDIIKTFGGKTTKDKIGKRIYDKILQIKKKSLDICSSTNESVS